MNQNNEKMELLSIKLFKKCLEYADFDSKTNTMSIKVAFFGLLLYPNIPSIWNFDILYLYKALQERHIEARIHDPHIRGSEGLMYGLYMGRQSATDTWSHSFDVIVLSTPHDYYVRNFFKLSQLFKPHKPCMWLDLFGSLSHLPLMAIGSDHTFDIVNFSDESEKAELLGGITPTVIE